MAQASRSGPVPGAAAAGEVKGVGAASLPAMSGNTAPTFAVHYAYTDDSAALDEHRPAHRSFLGQLAEEGLLLLAGAYRDAGAPAALLIVRAESAEEIRTVLRDDPFQQQGLVEEVQVREWTPVLGNLKDTFDPA